jgi:alkanesulfonate monooxygenase SsuD/methylene tetrahydromethanopterin reductase-like flavin-dependent oxidoreductase (luciferase family)
VIGGTGEKRTLRIAAEWADEWNLPGGDPETLRHKVEVLHGHCAEVGRDPAEIDVSVKSKADIDPGEFAEQAAALREAGANHIIAMFEAPFDPAELGALAGKLEGLAG